MHSLFWRILGAFWLALILTGTLSFLLTRFINQDSWILSQHPAFSQLTTNWLSLHGNKHDKEAQQLLNELRQKYRIFTQVFDEEGNILSSMTRMRAQPAHQNAQPGWRRLTQEVLDNQGNTFLFVYRIPNAELTKWRHNHMIGPIVLIAVAVFVLTLVSLLLTFSITRPLTRLRHAVHELGETSYQQQHLAKLAQRKDELGVLAADFNKMGQHVQDMLNSQRQLLRDVSHELRSPLARLQIGLALAERASPEKQQEFWPKLTQECERLDALINEILILARMEQEQPELEQTNLAGLLHKLTDDYQLVFPEQRIQVDCPAETELWLVSSFLQCALDNLLRNALRFNPANQPVKISVQQNEAGVNISIRDHGPGVEPELLEKLTQPFMRAQGQQYTGYGLGLSITERAVRRMRGRLSLANHSEGGFVARIHLPN